MHISFSMDGIKNMAQLYTYTPEYSSELGEGSEEHYHGDDYCKRTIMDILSVFAPTDWKCQKYLGSRDRLANETFALVASDDSEYTIAFAINTYSGEAARLEVVITAPEIMGYDHRLEKLKIALKNRLLPDWYQCTWLADEQAAALCKDAYEKTFTIENTLRAFASKVLIHFLGVDWIRKAGLEKEAGSVDTLKEKFIQRVSEFDNINTDFLSMTLETLVKVMFEGVIYKDEITLSRQDYIKIQELRDRAKTPANSIAEYIKGRRSMDKDIWNDLFAPYIDDQTAFKTAIHNFIEDRNHVAHSKVLSWSAYQVILQDFAKIGSLILEADTKFEHDETSDEIIQTWEAEQEELENDVEYFRDRLSSEAGIDILDADAIRNWFDEVLLELFDSVYQHYHFDVCYEISDLISGKGDMVFVVSCPAVEDGHAKIEVVAEYSIDDDLGSDSICYISARDGDGDEVCKGEIRFHNGDGCENEEGIMEATDNSEYDTSELEDLQNDLFEAIESLNPYPAKLNTLSYENKGAVQFVADFPCEQCGKFGVSIHEDFLPVGRCCYCGFENEMMECECCGELVCADVLQHGLCPSCVAYIEKQ